MKKIICFVLIFSILFLNISTCVFASVSEEEKLQYDSIFGKDNWVVESDGYVNFIDYYKMPEVEGRTAFTSFLGTALLGEAGFPASVLVAQVLKNKIKDLFSSRDIKVSNNNGIEISEKAAEELYKTFYDVATPLCGYYLLSTNSDKDTLYSLFKDTYNDGSPYPKLKEWLNDIFYNYDNVLVCKDTIFASVNSGSVVSFNDSLCFILEHYYGSQTALFYNYNNSPVTAYITGPILKDSSAAPMTGGSNSEQFTFFPNYLVLGYVGVPLKVFYSKYDYDVYLNQLNGTKTSNIFISSNFFNYSPDSYNIDLTKYNNTDWNGLNVDLSKTIENNVQQNITEKGDSLTSDEYQKIIDDAVKEIVDSINGGGSSGGDSGGGDSGGGDSGGGGNIDTSGIEGWLSKIHSLIDEFKKSVETNFAKLIDAVNSIKNLGSDESFLDKIWDFISNLVSTAVGDILAELLKLFVGEDGNLLDGITDKASALATSAQTKFPTSIPWDIVLIMGYFDAEPQAPKIEFPFVMKSIGINEKISIDFEKMEPLAKLSRSMFTITFLLFLVIQTRKLYGALNNGGD